VLLLLPPQQAGAWQAPRFQADWATRLREGRTEGQLLLRLETADLWFGTDAARCTAELDLRIEARTPAGFTPWAGHFRRSLEGDDQPAHRLTFAPPLAAGIYELRIAVADLRGGGLWTRSLTVVLEEWTGGWQLASLLLTEPGTTQPWVGAVAPDGVARLGWQTQLHAPKARPLQVETVLFRRETDVASELALPFRAVHEQREVVAVRAGVQPLRRSLPIAGLEPGEYLLLVQLWEGDRRVAEQSRRLVLRWPGVGAVLAQVETALDQLAAVAASAVVARLRAAGGADAQRAALLAYWADQALDPADYPTEALENYYRRVAAADSLWAEADRPGWQTERGRAWLRFGSPARRERQGRIERWHYPQLRLVLVFRSVAQ
jgi:GWxTD domain-containing protein